MEINELEPGNSSSVLQKIQELKALLPEGIGITAGQFYDYPEHPYEILGLTEYQVQMVAALLRGMTKHDKEEEQCQPL
jgi:hypothetical protein